MQNYCVWRIVPRRRILDIGVFDVVVIALLLIMTQGAYFRCHTINFSLDVETLNRIQFEIHLCFSRHEIHLVFVLLCY